MFNKRVKLLLLALISLLFAGCGKNEEIDVVSEPLKPVTLKVGHVGHDHHLALFVACDLSEKLSANGVTLKKVVDKKLYELFKDGKKVADIELVKVGGGSKMPTAISQGIIEMGFGGTAAVLASIDKGAPLKLISPLHYKGDMFVTVPDFPANNWKEFVEVVKKRDKPLRIGYKSPIAVAKIIFENALKYEGISFSTEVSAKAQIHLVNVKGGGKLNPSLGKIIDGYVGNNPFPAKGKEKGILKIISDLEELPPGDFKDHPCCCIAASLDTINNKSEAVTCMLELFIKATEHINSDLDSASKIASRWIGTSESVEKGSIPTSGYSMDDSAKWHGTMTMWLKSMNDLKAFSGKLKGLEEKDVAKQAYDLSNLTKAKENLSKGK